MKSIEKLESVAYGIKLSTSKALVTAYGDKEGDIMDYDVKMALRTATNEIKQELKERYIELPVDANGVPINYGDRLTDGEYTFMVASMEYHGYCSWSILNEDGSAWACCDVEHAPDPTKQLKPCPFCGSNDLYIVEQMIGREAPFASLDGNTVGIFCNNCKQTVTLDDNEDEGRSLDTEQRAVEAWNRRVGE